MLNPVSCIKLNWDEKIIFALSCSNTGEVSKYEESLQDEEQQSREFWDDPENFYGDGEDEVYYRSGFDWNDRNNPCSDAYFSPIKRFQEISLHQPGFDGQEGG